jgi:hypothetical protein
MKDEVVAAQQLVVKDLGLQQPKSAFTDLEKLQSWLAREISVLLDRDFQGLINILYRIDVSEAKLKAAFAASDVSESIAGLIIERELQKVMSRKNRKSE